jgi:hypothetical protein
VVQELVNETKTTSKFERQDGSDVGATLVTELNPKMMLEMFEFGQTLNAGHSPSADITSDPTRIELSDFRQ